jgi:hypothetical protein
VQGSVAAGISLKEKTETLLEPVMVVRGLRACPEARAAIKRNAKQRSPDPSKERLQEEGKTAIRAVFLCIIQIRDAISIVTFPVQFPADCSCQLTYSLSIKKKSPPPPPPQTQLK